MRARSFAIVAAVAALGAAATPEPLLAGTSSTCTVSMTNVSFGSVDVLPGTAVDTTTSISSSGQLAVASLSTGGSVGTIQIQATIQSVAGNVITLTVNGSPVQFTLPAGVTLPASLAGQAITLTLNLSSGNPVATPGAEQGDDNENDDQNDDDNQNDDNNDQNDDDNGDG